MFWRLGFIKLFFVGMFFVQYLNAVGTVILLHGTSSAGKTTLAVGLQKQFQGNWAIVSIDDFVYPAVFETAQQLGLVSTATMTGAEIHKIIAENIGMILAAFDNSVATSISWSSIKGDMYRSVNERAWQGENIILDTVLSASEFTGTSDFTQIMKDVPVCRVLVYCSPSVLIEHVMKRNRSENYIEHRDVVRVIQSFCDMYGPTDISGSQIDVITLADVEVLTDVDDVGRVAAASKLLCDAFHLDVHNAIGVAPRCAFDFCVDTGTMPLEKCLEIIHTNIVGTKL